MATTPNQITDQFQSQIGRAPTPFELTKYSTAPIQDLANLKTTYSGYKPDASVGDYLSFLGQDPSTANQQKYASMYGIDNYTNTYKQNQDLLSRIKNQQFTQPTKIAGGITTPGTKTDSSTSSTSVPGSVAGATNPNTSMSPDDTSSMSGGTSSTTDASGNAIPTELQTPYNDYTQSQQAVADINSRIDDLNNTIDDTLQDKRDEITRSGGIVNESQLRSTVLAENTPLLQERRDLLSQREQAVSEQGIASKAYTDAQNNYYKGANLDISEQKLTDAEQKQSDAETKQSQLFATTANSKYPDAGILPTDDSATILSKLEKSPTYLATLGAKVKSGTILPKLYITTDSSGNQSVIAVDPKSGKLLNSNATGGVKTPSTITTTQNSPWYDTWLSGGSKTDTKTSGGNSDGSVVPSGADPFAQ